MTGGGVEYTMAETGETVRDYYKRYVKPKYPWLIDPRKSKRIGYWDAITSVRRLSAARPARARDAERTRARGRLRSSSPPPSPRTRSPSSSPRPTFYF